MIHYYIHIRLHLDSVTKNLSFFATNYAAFGSALMVYEIVSDWSLLFWVFGVFGVWTFVLRAAAAGSLFPLEVGGMKVEKRTLYVTLSALTAIILTMYVGPTFLFVLGCTSAVAGGHALFRNPVSYKLRDQAVPTHDIEGVELGDSL